MGMAITKDRSVTIGLGTIASILATLGTVWSVGAPIAEAQISAEIKKQTQPLTDAFYTILLQNIESQKDTITALQYKREKCGNDVNCWTVRDARDLQRAQDILNAMTEAKTNLEKK